MTDELFSDCCGSLERDGFNEDTGWCFECRDHCGYIPEDDGDIDEPSGTTGQPYAQPTTPSIKDSLAAMAIVIGLAAFYGLMIIFGGN